MTVAELKKLLDTMPDHAVVALREPDEHGYYFAVSQVEKQEVESRIHADDNVDYCVLYAGGII